MKTATPLLLALALITTSACGQQENAEKRLSDLEKRVSALEKASPLSSLLHPTSTTPTTETKSPLQLVSWDAQLSRGQYSDYNYKITIGLKNSANKDIKLIEASVQFTDLLGAHIYGIKVTPDHLIPAGHSITDSGEYHVNQFEPEQARLAQMKKEDIKGTLVVSKLVFTDNTIGEYAP